MDKTLITPLDGIKPRPFTDRETSIRFINKVSIMIFLYIVFIIYPAYGLLRRVWVEAFPIVNIEGLVTAVVVAGLFSWFARRSITNRVVNQVESSD